MVPVVAIATTGTHRQKSFVCASRVAAIQPRSRLAQIRLKRSLMNHNSLYFWYPFKNLG
ncbi:hypothetical protein [Nostoc sp.]|uniref:hypothetical protein n=1 Tax=Nostoc sp. TaxID=1180 RepID=UPI002FF9DBF1